MAEWAVGARVSAESNHDEKDKKKMDDCPASARPQSGILLSEFNGLPCHVLLGRGTESLYTRSDQELAPQRQARGQTFHAPLPMNLTFRADEPDVSSWTCRCPIRSPEYSGGRQSGAPLGPLMSLGLASGSGPPHTTHTNIHPSLR